MGAGGYVENGRVNGMYILLMRVLSHYILFRKSCIVTRTGRFSIQEK